MTKRRKAAPAKKAEQPRAVVVSNRLPPGMPRHAGVDAFGVQAQFLTPTNRAMRHAMGRAMRSGA